MCKGKNEMRPLELDARSGASLGRVPGASLVVKFQKRVEKAELSHRRGANIVWRNQRVGAESREHLMLQGGHALLVSTQRHGIILIALRSIDCPPWPLRQLNSPRRRRNVSLTANSILC